MQQNDTSVRLASGPSILKVGQLQCAITLHNVGNYNVWILASFRLVFRCLIGKDSLLGLKMFIGVCLSSNLSGLTAQMLCFLLPTAVPNKPFMSITHCIFIKHFNTGCALQLNASPQKLQHGSTLF